MMTMKEPSDSEITYATITPEQRIAEDYDPPTLSLDIDSVLADTHVLMSRVVKEKWGVSWPHAAIYQWGAEKILRHLYDIKLTGKQFLALFDSVWEHWDEIPMTEPFVQEVLPDLQEGGFEVEITTFAKTDMQFQHKLLWLSKWGLGDVPTINARDGAEWKWQLPYDIFVDDCPHIVVGAVAHGKIGILYDQPWNRGVSKPYMTERIESLEVLRGVLEMVM